MAVAVPKVRARDPAVPVEPVSRYTEIWLVKLWPLCDYLPPYCAGLTVYHKLGEG